MKQFNRDIGNMGEEIAANYLSGKGYEIIEKNYRNKFGELDIVARKDGMLIFVEVKTKLGEIYGLPEEMVGRGKIQKVRHMGQVYMQGNEQPCRIDVVAIVLNEKHEVQRLTHHENVY